MWKHAACEECQPCTENYTYKYDSGACKGVKGINTSCVNINGVTDLFCAQIVKREEAEPCMRVFAASEQCRQSTQFSQATLSDAEPDIWGRVWNRYNPSKKEEKS